MGQTSHPAIQPIEHHGNEDRHRCPFEIPLHRLHDGKKSGEQRGRRKQVGQHVNTAPFNFRVEQRFTGLEFGHGQTISGQLEKDTPGAARIHKQQGRCI